MKPEQKRTEIYLFHQTCSSHFIISREKYLQPRNLTRVVSTSCYFGENVLGRGFPLTYTSGGNFLHRPFIDVPALQMTTSWFTMQNVFNSRFCQIMERDFFR
ncbi:unnamed protein product [Schistosoma rodhaini]|nr:unnamed protein product [Schistosoma rodhaini]